METWTQQRQTKLGLATIKIVQVQDLFEATVSLVNGGIDLIFQATETFGDARSAFHWSYGLKQSVNDDYAGFKRESNNLVETHPAKGKIALVYTIEEVISAIKTSYDNFELGRTSASKSDSISTKEVKASTLSLEDQTTLLTLMAKAKGTVSNG